MTMEQQVENIKKERKIVKIHQIEYQVLKKHNNWNKTLLE